MSAFHLLTLSLITLSIINPTLTNTELPQNLEIYGRAQITPNSVILTNHSSIIIKNPINFLTPTSFSTHLSFSLSHKSTLSLLLIKQHFKHRLIKFASGSIKIQNISTPSHILDSSYGKRHEAAVEYKAGSRSLEVNLGNGPWIVSDVDLSGMWKGEEVLVGLESDFNTTFVYSWRFRARSVSKGMHSMPVDPNVRVRVRSEGVPCYLTVVSAVMIAAGCCVFLVFMVMFFKVVFTDWEEVMEMEYVLKPVGKGYEKVAVDVENDMYGNIKG